MITAVFTDGDDCVWAYGLWQWDYGQQLRIEGLHLPTVVEIHFSLQEAGGEAVPRVGVTKDGVTTVTIPDSMLDVYKRQVPGTVSCRISGWRQSRHRERYSIIRPGAGDYRSTCIGNMTCLLYTSH